MNPKHKGLAAGLLAGVIAIAPAAALAAGGNSVTISGPTSAHVGKKFKYTVSGHVTKTGPGFNTFINTRLRCPATYKAELRTPYAKTAPPGFPVKVTSKNFRGKFTVTPKAKGPHYICAYLFRRSSKKTLAHASHKYVTSR